LSLQNKKILFTGGSLDDKNGTADAFILDIISESLTELPNLRNPRRSHSMAWIDGAPSVIGGYHQK
jgi:hypothetical protein